MSRAHPSQVLAVATALLIAAPAVAVKGDTDVTVHNRFAFDLYHELASADPHANVFCSPLSVAYALAMLHEGATGQTRSEIVEALHMGDLDAAAVADRFQALTSLLSGDEPTGLAIANGIWVARDTRLKPEFAARIEAAFSGQIATAPFRSDPRAAEDAINAWVSERTHHLIPELFERGDLAPDTRAVLVNALHFKGRWTYQFDPDRTRPASFKTADGRDVQVQMMSQANARVGMGAAGDRVAVELTYADSPLAMLLILPRREATLADVERGLDAAALDALVASLKPRDQLDVFGMPKFRIETSYDLRESMNALGIRRAWTGAAELDSITDEPLALSKAVHKAVLDVDEEGTEAAAATGLAMRAVSASQMVINRAFLAIIRDTRSGAIIFIGRVADPRSE